MIGFRKNDERIIAKIENLEEKIAEKYVRKDDFHREMNRFDLKLDAVKEQLTELGKAVSELNGLIKAVYKQGGY
jgi:chromosome segregation ATPase